MPHEISPNIILSDDVYQALSNMLPVVALESTVITHGLPYPQNQNLAMDMERQVRDEGATPATVALMDGNIKLGLDRAELEWLSKTSGLHKISSRDFGPAMAKHWSGGTTVAATMVAAYAAGIKVFATGGIGGVHRCFGGDNAKLATDISADLTQLARTPMVVVCAGAKAILDLPATLEYLETWAVPVAGYQVDEFPAFYSRESGLSVSVKADSAQDVAQIARAHWQMGFQSAVLVANPPPADQALPREVVEHAIDQALEDAARQGVRGQKVTPFLLQRMAEITAGASVNANLALLLNNARVAAEIAKAFSH
jgi:pseudouridine-5'-phosphate glycosidase